MSTSSDSIRFIGQKDLLRLTGLARGTWSSWLRNGQLDGVENALYDENDVISTAVFSSLTNVLPVGDAAIAWRECGAAVVGACAELPLDGGEPLVLTIDLQTLEGKATSSPEVLFKMIHSSVPTPRGWISIPIAARVREARNGFWKRAKPKSAFAKDGRRRRKSSVGQSSG